MLSDSELPDCKFINCNSEMLISTLLLSRQDLPIVLNCGEAKMALGRLMVVQSLKP